MFGVSVSPQEQRKRNLAALIQALEIILDITEKQCLCTTDVELLAVQFLSMLSTETSSVLSIRLIWLFIKSTKMEKPYT